MEDAGILVVEDTSLSSSLILSTLIDVVTFVTLNVRGGRDPVKRARIRNLCKLHKASKVWLIKGNSL